LNAEGSAFGGRDITVRVDVRPSEAKVAHSTLAVLLCGNFVTILYVFIVNVALPNIQLDLHASDADLQLVVISYSIAYGINLLNSARLGDLYGRRRIFLLGMTVFGFSSLFCSLSSSSWFLISARAIQGLGASLMMPQVYSSVRLLFDGDDRRRAFAVMGAVQGVAGVASQTIGGSLIALDFGSLGSRLIFLVNLPIAAYAVIVGRWLLPETKAEAPTKLDVAGALLGACALLSLLLPLLTGREQGWPWWAIGGLILFLPLLGTFTLYEQRLARLGGAPIIDVSLFRNMKFSTGVVIGFFFYSAISSFSLSLTVLLQVGLHRTPIQAALIFLPSTVAFFLGAVTSASAMKRLGRHALSLGMAVFAVGLITSAMGVFIGDWSLLALSASVTFQGFGQGVVIPSLLNVVLSVVTSSEAGMASGAFSVAQTIGSSCGVTIVGLILFSTINNVIGSSQEQTYAASFALATLYNIAAVLLSLILLTIGKKEE
jgi:MFS family permease